MTHDFAIARLQSINPTLDATAALLSAAGGDFRPLLEFGFELAPHPLGVTLYRGGMGAVVTNPPDTSKVEAAVLGLTNARKPLDTGLGSAIDEAVPLYPTEAALTTYAAAWNTLKDAADAANMESIGFVSDTQIALIEPGIRLLELSAAYRAAHALYSTTLVAADAALTGPRPVWDYANAAHEEAEGAMEAAKQALLAAALDIT